MNDSTPPPGTADPSGPAGSDPGPDRNGSAPGGGFFTWLRGLGIVRGDERWFAGVAGGVARRADIDPLIVRGIFVVLALLGGPGILLYLAGWLLLPDASGRIHVEEIVRGRASTGVIVTAAVLAGLVVIPVFFGLVLGGAPMFGTPSFWGWDLWASMGVPSWLMRTVSWLFWIGVIVACAFLVRHLILQRGRESRAQDPGPSTAQGAGPVPPHGGFEDRSSSNPAGSATSAGFTAPADSSAPASRTDPPTAGFSEQPRAFADRAETFAAQAGERAQDWSEKAGAWGEDVGRRADEWSARYAEHHDAHKLGAAHTVITFALALLAGGLAALWALNAGPALDATAPGAPSGTLVAALIAALAVFAVSLIVAGVRGRNTGWVGFLSFCGVIALLFSAVLPWGTRFQPFGVTHVDEAQSPGVVMIAGSTQVDLRGLDSSTAPDDIAVWQLAGNSTVRLPDSHPTIVSVRVLAGNISEQSPGYDGFRTSGPFLLHNTGVGLAQSNTASGEGTTRVTIYLLAGNVRITGDAVDRERERTEGSSSGSRVQLGSTTRTDEKEWSR